MSAINTLIFSDLDGTLLDHYNYQWRAAQSTLEALKCAHIPVILNTSKTLAELNTIHSQLNLDTPFIIENGAAIYIPTQTFEKQPQDTIKVGRYWVKSFCLPHAYWTKLIDEHSVSFAQYFQRFSTMTDQALSELTGLSLAEARRAKQRQFGEPIHWIGDSATKQLFIDKLIQLGANVVQGGRFIHVGGHCDKGQALIWLTKQYKKQLNNPEIYTIALGDGENDSAMLESSDIAVQVRSPVHSFPTLRRQYNVTQTTLMGPQGWVEAIEQLLPKQFSATKNSTAELSNTKYSNTQLYSGVNHG